MFPCASADVEFRCMSRKSRKRPLPPPFSVPNAARNRSRSAAVSVSASLRIRTVTGLLPRTPRLPVPRASIVVSPSVTLGRPNSPATKNRTGAPLTGRSNARVGVPRCVRVVANLTRPTVPTLRSVILIGAGADRVEQPRTRLDRRPREEAAAERIQTREDQLNGHGRSDDRDRLREPTVADRSHRTDADLIAAATSLAIRHGFPLRCSTRCYCARSYRTTQRQAR